MEDFRVKGIDCRVVFYVGGCVEDDILVGLRRLIFFLIVDGFFIIVVKGRFFMIDVFGDVEVLVDVL